MAGRDILRCLVYSPAAHHGHGCTRPKPGARNSSWLSHVGQGLALEPSSAVFCCFPRHMHRGLDRKWSGDNVLQAAALSTAPQTGPPKTNFLSDLSSYNTNVTTPRTLLFCLPIGIHVAFFFFVVLKYGFLSGVAISFPEDSSICDLFVLMYGLLFY